MKRLHACCAAALGLTCTPAFAAGPEQQQTTKPASPPPQISVALDASQAAQRILHARLTIQATPGPLTLLYPRWIPGEHAPAGPVVDLTGLTFSANGKRIPWRRDDVNMYAFHLTVPEGATAVEATLDYVSPATQEGGFTTGVSATDKLAVVNWNHLVLYPAGYKAEELTCAPSLKLPAGWKFGTALPVARQAGDTVQFQKASLYTLVDSPVITGQYFRRVPLAPPGKAPPHDMDIAADSEAALAMSAETEAHYKQLVAEAGALFGGWPYRDYHFLYTLSDRVAHFGLEHHESSDDRTYERALIDEDTRKLTAYLLPHEFVHAWNGKYRRPSGLSTTDYEQPMKGAMLWVYEGLTEYLGFVLTARSGLWSADDYRQNLALMAARLSHQPGRAWRPLLDTAVAAQLLYSAPEPWASYRRGTDFYEEGALIWLEVDATIRSLTHNRASLDDFCKLFFMPPSAPMTQAPAMKPFTFDELVAALNKVAPHDWRKLLTDRLSDTSPKAPLGGLEGSGWRLVYRESEPALLATREALSSITDETFSIGLRINSRTGQIIDAVLSMPAAKAGIAPGMRLTAVNGRAFSPEVLRDALRASKSTSQPLELLIANAGYYHTHAVDYHGGARYPHLERDSARADLLQHMLRPRAPLMYRPTKS